METATQGVGGGGVHVKQLSSRGKVDAQQDIITLSILIYCNYLATQKGRSG